MQPQVLDLNTVISDVLELYRAPKAGPKLSTQLGSELPLLEADPDQLRQVLHNLIKNAVEASGTGKRATVSIETRCVKEAACNYVELRVRDDGVGFPAEIVDHVFEPYVTTKREGSGLGLPIVKKIVEEHGGVVRAENHPEGGASVVIRFPVLPAAATHDREQSSSSAQQTKRASATYSSPPLRRKDAGSREKAS